MHGRKRFVAPAEAENLREASLKKAATFTELMGLLLKHRRESNFSSETLNLTGKVLRMHPDYSSLWNYRREILLHMHSALGLKKEINPVQTAAATATSPPPPLSSQNAKISNEIGGTIRDEELALSADSIRKNPKSCKHMFLESWENILLLS